MKITEKHVVLSSSSTTRKQLFAELGKMGKSLGIVEDAKELEKGFWDREDEGSTGLEGGFAIPHAKMDSITVPTVIVLKTKTSINDYKTFDNSKVKNVIALLIPNKNVKKDHIKILSAIAVKLTDQDFIKEINGAKTKDAIVKAMSKIDFSGKVAKVAAATPKKGGYNIIGITSCAAGVAHTFMAADNLIKKGAELGHNVRIETQGATGPETVLTTEEINNADYVVIASDIDVEMSRFNGKRVYRTNVAHAVKNASEVFTNAFSKSSIQDGVNMSGASAAGPKKGPLAAIMNGISWMIPLLVAVAILLAIPNIVGAFTDDPEIIKGGNYEAYAAAGYTGAWWRFMAVLSKMGFSAIPLMFPIFAAYVAMALGNKPAFIPGFIGGFLAQPSMYFGKDWGGIFTDGMYPFTDKVSGFWGAMIIGLVIGYIIRYSNQYIKVPKIMASIKPMLILPFIGTLSSVTLMLLVINPAFGFVNQAMIDGLSGLGDVGEYVYAMVIAPMTATDLGGPVNKAAGSVAVALWAGGGEDMVFSLAVRVIAIVVPSIGMGMAALLDRFIVRRRVFNDELRKVAPNAIILACLGISEGGLPFMMKRPLITIPVNMVGATIGAMFGVAFGVIQNFPDSAIWAWGFAEPAWGYVLALIIGSVATALMHIFFRLLLIKMGKLTIEAEPIQPIQWNNLLRRNR